MSYFSSYATKLLLNLLPVIFGTSKKLVTTARKFFIDHFAYLNGTLSINTLIRINGKNSTLCAFSEKIM